MFQVGENPELGIHTAGEVKGAPDCSSNGPREVWSEMECSPDLVQSSLTIPLLSGETDRTCRPEPDTRIFSSLTGARLYDTIGRYMYLFKLLTAVFRASFYRFEHIVSYSSGKVMGKVAARVSGESGYIGR
jgi:hypothetical protein